MSKFRLASSCVKPESPIQPLRSSRCGQSLGTLIRLDAWPHVTACDNWFRTLAVVGKATPPADATALRKCRPCTMSRVGGYGRPVIST